MNAGVNETEMGDSMKTGLLARFQEGHNTDEELCRTAMVMGMDGMCFKD